MAITPLDYEQTLAALQAFIGEPVWVSISHGDTEYMGANLVGPLRSATEADLAKQVPELKGQFAGESLFFVVGDPQEPAFSTFALWQNGFEWGRALDRPHGKTVALQVAGLVIRVRPAQDLPAG
jgi:hypothetical protein